jgi:uncharacterized protein (DUF2249 family)
VGVLSETAVAAIARRHVEIQPPMPAFMSSETATMDLTEFDVRVIPCRQKHAMIFARWADLPVGDHFILINDHDPVPLYYQFAAMFPGCFTWDYVVPGPYEYRVRITRVAASATEPLVAPPRPQTAAAPVARQAITLDARGLEPPEPMMRILAAAESMPANAQLEAHTERRPIHLFGELETRGLAHRCEDQADGTCITSIWRR